MHSLLRDRETKGKKLNLGCGYNHLAGCINADNNSDCCPDLLLDLQKFPWAIETDSIHYVCAVNVLERLPNLLGFLGELYNICAPDARVEFVVPHAFHQTAVEDPTHCRFFGPSSWQYFEAKTYQGNTGWYTKDRFNFVTEKIETVIGQECDDDFVALAELANNRQLSPMLIAFIRTLFQLHSVNVVSHLVFRLRAVKPLPPNGNVRLNKYE